MRRFDVKNLKKVKTVMTFDFSNVTFFGEHAFPFEMRMACVVGLMGVVPVAVEYTDLSCSCDDEAYVGTALCQGRSVECNISRFSTFLLMSISYAIAGTVIRLMITIWRNHFLVDLFEKAYYQVFCVLIPLVCALATGFLDFQVTIFVCIFYSLFGS